MEANDEKAPEAIGAISKVTLREFDAACPQPVQALAPEAIRALREREHLSQAVFAAYLNISKHLVSDWERGKRKPGGSALKLLNGIQKYGIEVVA